MSKGLGALVFVVGVAGLSYWGAKVQAVAMQDQIATAAAAAVAQAVHPIALRVGGRDITVSGIADTEAERDGLLAGLDGVRGRRVVNDATIAVLPDVTPYETALAKAADGSLAATGYAPSDAAKAALADAGVPVDGLALGHGAPETWGAAVAAGAAALAPLDAGSFSLTGTTLTLAGVTATPREEAAARAALAAAGDYETVVALDVTDPGLVDFALRYSAERGFALDGVLPAAVGVDGIAKALGAPVAAGDVGTTFADLPGLEATIARLGPVERLVETLTASGTNDGLSVAAEALPGLDPAAVAAALRGALGAEVAVAVTAPTAPAPADGAQRLVPATGATQVAHSGTWITMPVLEPTKANCTEAAMSRVGAAPIAFVTGSAELDPASLEVINDLAGILMLCTREAGMRVVVGGHTDAEGDDAANYVLSMARARAVRDALAQRGVPLWKMTAIGYGETEPVADNATEEGRAQNRRTTFEWPN